MATNIQQFFSKELLFIAAFQDVRKYIGVNELCSISRVCKLWDLVVKEGAIPFILTSAQLNHQSPLAQFFVSNFPYLNECSCVRAPQSERQRVVHHLIEGLKKGKETQLQKSCVVQSVGCGGCLRELVLAVYLHELGVQNLHLILTDPCIGVVESNWISREKLDSQRRPNLNQTADSLMCFFKLYMPKYRVTVECSKSLNQYLKNRRDFTKPDILLMLDIDFLDVLKKSFKMLVEANALSSTTLIGWTQFRKEALTDSYKAQSYVMTASDTNEINKLIC